MRLAALSVILGFGLVAMTIVLIAHAAMNAGPETIARCCFMFVTVLYFTVRGIHVWLREVFRCG